MNTKKISFISFLFTLLTSVVFGQQVIPLQQDTSMLSHQVSMFGNGFYLSNTLQNDFTKKLVLGGYISDDIKSRSMKHMVSRNRLGSNISAEINYENFKVNLFGNKKWGMIIRAGYGLFNAVKFSKDAFELGFLGNGQLTNNPADLSNLSVSSISYQKIGFGVIDKHSKSSIVLNFVNANSFYKGGITQGNFSQSPNYDTVGLNINGNLAYNNQKHFFNGQGFSFDFDFRVAFNWMKTKKAYIQIMAKNIGMVFFDKQTNYYSADTSYRYSGFQFNQAIGGHPLVSQNFSVLDTLNIQHSNKAKPIWLPGYIQVGKIVDRNNPSKWQSFFGIDVYTSLICLPQIYAGVHYQPTKWFAAGLQASYGGFGGLRGGFYLDFRMNNFALGIASNDLYGLFSKRGYGNSAQIRLTWLIK